MATNSRERITARVRILKILVNFTRNLPPIFLISYIITLNYNGS